MNSCYALNLPVIAACLEADVLAGAKRQSPDIFLVYSGSLSG